MEHSLPRFREAGRQVTREGMARCFMAVGCGVLFDRNGTGGWGNSPGWWSVLTHHGPGFFGRDISNIRAGRIRRSQDGKKRDVLIERVAGSVDDVLGNEDRLAGIDPAFRVSTVGLSGRGDWIRTSDLFVPNEARYQAALRPDCGRGGWVNSGAGQAERGFGKILGEPSAGGTSSKNRAHVFDCREASG